MKSTTDIKAVTKKNKQTRVNNYRFWLVLSCAGLVGLWYVLVAALFLAVQSTLVNLTADASYTVYNRLFFVGTFAVLFLVSALCLPVAAAVFKKLKIQKPLVSGVAFFAALVFGISLFLTVAVLTNYELAAYYVIPTSMIAAGLVYGFALRPLKHKLSTAWFLVIAIGLSIVPILLAAAQSL